MFAPFRRPTSERVGRCAGPCVVGVAVGCLVVFVVSCSGPSFGRGAEADEVVAALQEAGFEICGRQRADAELPGGAGRQAIDVGVGRCGGAASKGTVVVQEFDSENAREAAIRNVYRQGRQRPFVAPFPYESFVIRLMPGADTEVHDRYEDAIAILESSSR